MDRTEWVCKNLIPMQVAKVRIGREADGGYVLPRQSLSECDLCVSYGLGHDTSFERRIRRRGIKVVGFDPDISKHPKWARAGRVTKYSDFSFLPEVGRAGNVLLKMDVEGSEYGFLKTLDSAHFAEKVHTFALEIHTGRKLRPQWADLHMLDAVLKSHSVVHVHSNNYGTVENFVASSLEITFMTKKRMPEMKPDRRKYPVRGLDHPNNPRKPDFCMMWINQVPLL